MTDGTLRAAGKSPLRTSTFATRYRDDNLRTLPSELYGYGGGLHGNP